VVFIPGQDRFSLTQMPLGTKTRSNQGDTGELRKHLEIPLFELNVGKKSVAELIRRFRAACRCGKSLDNPNSNAF
jgi:hypothetical protein